MLYSLSGGGDEQYSGGAERSARVSESILQDSRQKHLRRQVSHRHGSQPRAFTLILSPALSLLCCYEPLHIVCS